MAKCIDCGCGLNQGICSNCHEELHIDVFQKDGSEEPSSPEWQDKVIEQVSAVQKQRLERKAGIQNEIDTCTCRLKNMSVEDRDYAELWDKRVDLKH